MANKVTTIIDARDKSSPAFKKARKQLKGFKKEAHLAGGAAGKMTGQLSGLAKSIGIMAVAMGTIRIGQNLIQAASDAEEIGSKFNVVFRGMNEEMNDWVADFSTSMGRADQDIKNFTAGIADVLKPMGLQTAAAADMSKKMTQLALDVASFNNRQDADVIHSFTSALTGERESLKTLGIVIQETDVQTKMLEQATAGLTYETEKEAKAQATFALMLDATHDAQGDLLRTGESYANQLKRTQSEVKNLSEKLGKELLPAATAVVKAIGELAVFLRENSDQMKAAAKIATQLGIALGGAKMIGMITLFGSSIAKSMLVAKASMVTTGGVAMTLKATLASIPRMIQISVVLLGAQLAITQLNKLADAMEAAQMKSVEADTAHLKRTRDTLAMKRAIAGADSKNAKQLIGLIEKREKMQEDIVYIEKQSLLVGAPKEKLQEELNRLVQNEAGMKSTILRISKELADEEAAKWNKTMGNYDSVLKKIGEIKSKAEEDPVVRAAKKVARASGGGAAEDTVAKEAAAAAATAEKEAERIIKVQDDIFERLKKTRGGFAELRTSGVDALVDLASEHQKAMAEMSAQASELAATLGELKTAYDIQVKGFDKSAAERVVDQEEMISSLQRDISEGVAKGDDTGALQQRLEKEKSALRAFMQENRGLDDEIAAARQRASLTDFQRFTDDLSAKRDAALDDYNDNVESVKKEIELLQKKSEEEQAIYEAKRAGIEKINEAIKNNWSDILGHMENRTDRFAKMAQAKLESIKRQFEEMSALTGGASTAEGIRTAKEYLPEGSAALFSGQPHTAPQNNISVNLELGSVTVTKQEDVEALIDRFQSGLARAAELISKNTSPVPTL